MAIDKKKATYGYLLVALASVLWGTMGLMGRLLLNYDVSPYLISFWKLLFGFCILFVYIYIKDKSLLKIDRKGLIKVAIIGLFCQAVYNVSMFSAVQHTTIATATVLLYTAPCFVMVMARIFFKELITPYKVVVLLMSLFGCYLTVTAGSFEALSINLIGIFFGLSAALNFAIMTISTKGMLLRGYHQWTIILYMFGFGCLFSLLFTNPLEVFGYANSRNIWISLFLLGLIPTALSYVFYIKGLSFDVESSKVGIITTLEVAVAVLISYFLFKEVITFIQFIGTVLVLTAVVVLQLEKHLSQRYLHMVEIKKMKA